MHRHRCPQAVCVAGEPAGQRWRLRHRTATSARSAPAPPRIAITGYRPYITGYTSEGIWSVWDAAWTPIFVSTAEARRNSRGEHVRSDLRQVGAQPFRTWATTRRTGIGSAAMVDLPRPSRPASRDNDPRARIADGLRHLAQNAADEYGWQDPERAAFAEMPAEVLAALDAHADQGVPLPWSAQRAASDRSRPGSACAKDTGRPRTGPTGRGLRVSVGPGRFSGTPSPGGRP